MTILDRYIVRQFSLTFLFALFAFLLIFLVVDLMEKLDDFVDAGVGALIVLSYYMYFMPEIIRLMIPVAMLMAALFVTGRMASQTGAIENWRRALSIRPGYEDALYALDFVGATP